MSDEEFAAFATREAPVLLRAAVALTGRPAEAQDLVQDTLERVLRRWRRGVPDAPSTYARRVLVHRATDHWRRRVRYGRIEPRLVTLGSHDPYEAADERDALLVALAGLPRAQRQVVVLRHVLDLTEADTAAALRCSLGTVKSQSSRGLARLREALTPTPEVRP